MQDKTTFVSAETYRQKEESLSIHSIASSQEDSSLQSTTTSPRKWKRRAMGEMSISTSELNKNGGTKRGMAYIENI